MVGDISPEWGDGWRAVVEIPQHDARSRRVRLADLLELSAVAGALACRFDARGVTPSEWKGNAPKEVTAARAVNALTWAEVAKTELDLADVPASLRHNVWDAIAIGLWALGRLPGAAGATTPATASPAGRGGGARSRAGRRGARGLRASRRPRP